MAKDIIINDVTFLYCTQFTVFGGFAPFNPLYYKLTLVAENRRVD